MTKSLVIMLIGSHVLKTWKPNPYIASTQKIHSSAEKYIKFNIQIS